MFKSTCSAWMIVIIAAVVLIAAPQQTLAGDFHEDMGEVELSKKQQKEMSELHSSILEQKKTVIEKYVEFGVIPTEKSEKIKSHLEERYADLEDNGFVPLPHHHHKKSEEKEAS
ncbi:DUF2680 domain-containing protein [Salibacterium salarium]|uniref:DUF2680 domain-containing protein n=1 Tax=Salibacterium salarium TaxID=284579 RepID=A0A428MVJ5_9BACI|nr:DUF2680 domain-containing protein [Salibacterium salarium]RSL30183.1 DUF2680 domain-containing protein [Salibacterium salarium]